MPTARGLHHILGHLARRRGRAVLVLQRARLDRRRHADGAAGEVPAVAKQTTLKNQNEHAELESNDFLRDPFTFRRFYHTSKRFAVFLWRAIHAAHPCLSESLVAIALAKEASA